MWNCPYSNDYFREYAEPEDGETVRFLSELASEIWVVYLIGGSIPELDGDRVYNTSFSFDRKGNYHRQAQEGASLRYRRRRAAYRFMESDTLTAGK